MLSKLAAAYTGYRRDGRRRLDKGMGERILKHLVLLGSKYVLIS